MLPEPIGARIKRLRDDRAWTLEILAARMQTRGHRTMRAQRLNEIELGKRKIKHDELVSLARIFGVAITELLGVPDRALD